MSSSRCPLAGREVLLATRNPAKSLEIREILSGLGARWRTLEEFPGVLDPEETGATFAENARLKALYYAEATGYMSLSDDSGLEVDALGGRPGVHSARYAGPAKDDAANNALLVSELVGVPAERRTARFRCAAALAEPGRIIAQAEGTIEGVIIDEPRGENGFGYDPHFLVPHLGRTTAELTTSEKSRISHRGHALRSLAERLLRAS